MARVRRRKSKKGRKTGRSETLVCADEIGKVRHPMELICGACGKTARYQVGAVLLSPRIFDDPSFSANLPDDAESSPFARVGDYVGFTRYFRCRRCDAGGPWELTETAKLHLTVLMAAFDFGDEDCGFFIAENRTRDGQHFRYPTEAEAYIKGKLEHAPDDTSLWLRLGNVYHQGERNDLAEPAYRRALEIDPDDVEAHAVMADLLHEIGRMRKALSNWKAVLQKARHAQHVPREQRLEWVSAALDHCLSFAEDPKEIFDLLPMADPAELASRQGPIAVEIRAWDLGNPRDWDDICSVFVDGRAPVRRLSHGWTRTTRPRVVKETTDTSPPMDDLDAPRNAPCPCGSGRKYKKCCGRTEGPSTRALSLPGRLSIARQRG